MTWRGWRHWVTGVAVVGVAALAVPAVLPPADGLAAELVGATGSATAPPAPPPPAPAGFAGQVESLYSEVYQADQLLDARDSSLGAASQVPSPAQLDQSVSALTAGELAELYQATQQNAQWATLPAALRQVIGDLGGTTPAATSAAATSSAVSAPARANLLAATTFPPTPPTGPFTPPPASYTPSTPVGPYQPSSCPTGAPGGPPDAPGEAAIYAVQLTMDIAASVAQDVPGTITVIIAGEGTSIPDPAKYVAEAIQLAAAVTLDTFNYLQAVANDCDQSNRDGYLANIDNTTVNIFNLLTLTEATLGNVEKSVNAVNQQVNVVQTTLDEELTLAIEQALTAPATSPPNAAYELPASLGGYLDSTPIGVAEVVTHALSAATQAGLPVNAASSDDLSAAKAALAAGNDAGAYQEFAAAYRQAAG